MPVGWNRGSCVLAACWVWQWRLAVVYWVRGYSFSKIDLYFSSNSLEVNVSIGGNSIFSKTPKPLSLVIMKSAFPEIAQSTNLLSSWSLSRFHLKCGETLIIFGGNRRKSNVKSVFSIPYLDEIISWYSFIISVDIHSSYFPYTRYSKIQCNLKLGASETKNTLVSNTNLSFFI